jgi:Putative F0F1-ATPase subunit Ca2+/Mg2+ transporter
MPDPSGDKRPPMAAAMEWVSQITTVVLMMILPGLLGQWLDRRWGTGFLALVGFGLGLTTGIWHLLRVTSRGNRVASHPGKEPDRDAFWRLPSKKQDEVRPEAGGSSETGGSPENSREE